MISGCDCGACCTQCGHDDDCMINEQPKADNSDDAYELG